MYKLGAFQVPPSQNGLGRLLSSRSQESKYATVQKKRNNRKMAYDLASQLEKEISQNISHLSVKLVFLSFPGGITQNECFSNGLLPMFMLHQRMMQA